MRDSSEGMSELVRLYRRDAIHCCAVRAAVDPKRLVEVLVSPAGYRALSEMFNRRPSDDLPGLVYRYFFAGSATRRSNTECEATIRIECGKSAKHFPVPMPVDVVANLIWIHECEDPQQLAHLPAAPDAG